MMMMMTMMMMVMMMMMMNVLCYFADVKGGPKRLYTKMQAECSSEMSLST